MDNQKVESLLDIEIFSADVSFFANGVKNRLNYEINKDFSPEELSYSVTKTVIENGKKLIDTKNNDINASAQEIMNVLFSDFYSVRTIKLLGFFDFSLYGNPEDFKTYYFDFDMVQKKDKVNMKLYITENMDIIKSNTYSREEYAKEVAENASLEIEGYQVNDGSFIIEEDLVHYKIDTGDENLFEIFSYEPVFVLEKDRLPELCYYMLSKLMDRKLITTDSYLDTIEIKPA